MINFKRFDTQQVWLWKCEAYKAMKDYNHIKSNMNTSKVKYQSCEMSGNGNQGELRGKRTNMKHVC